jgi:protocatechuate 3,4-dioxygenase beta subunit
MRKPFAAPVAAGLRLGRFWRLAAASLAIAGTALVFAAPADVARGLAWLQAQAQADGSLQAAGHKAAAHQTRCETAATLLKLAGNSAQVSSLLAALQPQDAGDATETLACWQNLRQQLGQSILNSDLELRRVSQQGYAAYEGFGTSSAHDTGWALAARLENLGATDKANLLAWLQASQASDGSFATAGRPDLLATAVILRGLKHESAKSATAAAIAAKAAQWLLSQRNAQGHWRDDVAMTSIVFEAVHPYTGIDPAIASGVEAYLLGKQQTEGSWEGDPYVTAVALRALALTSVAPLDPSLATAATVRGVVTLASTGEPLAGVTIQAQPASGAVRSAVTDAEGSYLVQGITPGTIGLTASIAGHQTLTAQVTLQSGGVAVFSPAMYPTGAMPPSGARIKGRVVAFGSNTPLPGTVVTATGASQASAQTDALGAFDISVAAGSHTVSYSLAGYVTQNQQIILSGGATADLGTILMRPARSTSSLRGVVTDMSGQAIPGATVSVQNAGSTITNSAGAYSFPELSGLQFAVTVSATDYATRNLTLTTPQPGDLVQDFRLPGVSAAYLNLEQLVLSSNSVGLSGDITATAVISNPTAGEASGVATAVVSDADGKRIASIAGLDSSGNPLGAITLEPGTQTVVHFKWNSGQFAPGLHGFTARVQVPGSMNNENPDGVILASARQPLTIDAATSFIGSVTASPPVLRAGTGAAVKLSALLQNAGNIPLPAQDYRLAVVNSKTGQTTLTHTVSSDAVAVAELRSLQFPDWVPPGGGDFRLELTASSTTGSTITSTLYVGDSGSGTFTLDRQIVPSGTHTVLGTIKVTGQDATGTITDPLAPLIRQAVTKAVKYADTYAYNHYVNDLGCYACHVQAQAVKGGELNLRFTQPEDPLRRAILASSITQNQDKEGGIVHDGLWARVSNTTVGLWGIADWHDPASVALARARMAQFLVGWQQAGGFWEVEDPQAWWRRRAAMTAVNVGSFGQLKKYLQANPAPKTKGYSLVSPSPWMNPEKAVLRASPDGTLYVANWWYRNVWKMTPDGKTSVVVNDGRAYFSARPLADGGLLLASPSGVFIREVNGTLRRLTDLAAIDAQPYGDKFLVTSYNLDTTIYMVDRSGNATTLVRDKSLGRPAAVNVLADGSFLVSSDNSRKIIQYSASGQRLRTPVPFTNGYVRDTIPYGDGFLVATDNGVFFYNKEWVGVRWLPEGADSLAAMPSGDILLNKGLCYPGPCGIYRMTEGTFDAAGLIASMDASVNKAYSWLLNANWNFDNANNLDLAYRLMGLASVKAYDGGVSRGASHDSLIQSLAATLRSRQRADGGWVWTQGYHTVSDSLVTAVVSMALDTQDPSPGSPEVRKAIELLLGRQQADGSWRSENGLGTTPLLSSTWVEIWLPSMLDRLVRLNADVVTTFPPNITLSNPDRTPTSVVTAADGSSTFTWQLKSVAEAGQQFKFDLTLKDMQIDEVRPAAQHANLLFKNSHVPGTVTMAIEVPKVMVGTSLAHTVSADKPTYTEAEQAVFTVPIQNAGIEARDAFVRLTVLDGAGGPVEVLPLSAASSVAAGATVSVVTPWPVAGILSGSYQLKAELISPAGLRYGTATTTFAVTASQTQPVLARVTADRASYSAAQTVQLTSRASNATSNTLLENVQARTQVTNSSGGSVFNRTEQIDQLAPGGNRQYGYALAASGLQPGRYDASLQIVGATGSVLAQSTTTFSVLGADVTGVGLTGQLQATPDTLFIGQATQLALQATNRSTMALANVPLTVRVVDPMAGTVVATFTDTVADWQPGQAKSFAFPWVAAGTHGQILVAAASAQVGGKEIPLAQTNLKLLGILYTGTTQAVPGEVEAGSSAALNYTVTNPAPVGGHMLGSLAVQTLTGQQLAAWPLDLTIASGATYAGNQLYVTGEQQQRLNLILSQQLGTGTIVLATDTFTIADPPVPVGVTTGLKGKARFLVLVSCPPGLGTAEDAACVAQRSQAISSYLGALGYTAKTVSTDEAFLGEMRCGTYNTYWISNGAIKLTPQTIGELKQAVRRGEALWMDGVHDSRNRLLHETAGVKQVGKLATRDNLATLAEGGLYGAASQPTLGQPEQFELTTGAAQGSFAPQSARQAPVPAVVTNDWGSGKSLLFAFDLAAMVTADVVQAHAQLANFVRVSAGHAASGTPTLTIGDLTQLAATVTNQGTRTVTFKAQATLATGLTSISTEPAAQITTASDRSTVATWMFTLPAGAAQELTWLVQATQAGSFGTPLSVYSMPRAGSTAAPKLRATATMGAQVQAAQTLLAEPVAALSLLQPVGSSDKSNRTKAVSAVAAALSLQAQGSYEQAIVQWLAAADAVAAITSVDTTPAKQAIALALEASTDALCIQRCGSATCQ